MLSNELSRIDAAFLLLVSMQTSVQTCQSIPRPIPPFILFLMIAPKTKQPFHPLQPSSSATSFLPLSTSLSSLWATNDGGNSALLPHRRGRPTLTSSPITWLSWSWSLSWFFFSSFLVPVNQFSWQWGRISIVLSHQDRLCFTSSTVWSAMWLLFIPSPTWGWDSRADLGSDTLALGVFGCFALDHWLCLWLVRILISSMMPRSCSSPLVVPFTSAFLFSAFWFVQGQGKWVSTGLTNQSRGLSIQSW